MPVDLRLNAIVDPERAGGHDLADLARLCAQGGATLVQLRDKVSETRAMVEEARAIKAALAPFRVPFVVNDRIDVALAAKADGVHLGPDDMAIEDARALLGRGAIVGLSIKSVAEADAAPLDLIDYVGSGGVYVTLSKEQKNPPIGPQGLARIIAALHRRAANMPVVGIAGIDASNAAEVIGAGADGVAVISGAVAVTRSGRCSAQLARHRRRHAGEAGRLMGVPVAVTIAGSDSGGGAGIQADLKTFAALGVYGATVITALTAQNTKGVFAVHEVPADFITAQIDAVFSDLDVGAVKIGMLGNAAAIEAVAAGLVRHGARNVVLDPVMAATSGRETVARGCA